MIWLDIVHLNKEMTIVAEQKLVWGGLRSEPWFRCRQYGMICWKYIRFTSSTKFIMWMPPQRTIEDMAIAETCQSWTHTQTFRNDLYTRTNHFSGYPPIIKIWSHPCLKSWYLPCTVCFVWFEVVSEQRNRWQRTQSTARCFGHLCVRECDVVWYINGFVSV